MIRLLALLALANLAIMVLSDDTTEKDIRKLTKRMDELEKQAKEAVENLESLSSDMETERKKHENIVGGLTRQIMMQQLSTEESLRAGGISGIKSTRNVKIGTRPYYQSSHTNSRSINSIHDHSQNSYTVGMGEVVTVMNGVEFRTRHNDYPMRQPHPTKGNYQMTDFIEFPPVPPAVLEKERLGDQVKEMKEWFKAWRDQNYKVRDYRPYFKPVLCYMEGHWTQAGDAVEEGFESDRHFIDATTWWDLTEKVRYTAYSGSKDNNENYSFLPMKIMNLVNNNTEPVYAQWNYRILCAPVTDIPTRYLRPVDDLSSRMMNLHSMEDHVETRRARFYLHNYRDNAPDADMTCSWCYIDSVMEQIPGLNNYPGYLEDDSFGSFATKSSGEKLNTAYYHRYYKSNKKGAMGLVNRLRGFSDGTLFMAQTTQEKVPAIKVTDCKEGVCTDYKQRWTYAIPLEVIYMTPLWNWNPYELTYTNDRKSQQWDDVTKDGRNGGFTKDTAFFGTNRKTFYRTPEELFLGAGDIERDPADTSKGVVGVLDPKGKVRRVLASGVYIFLPNIPGVGRLRTRYPINPIHEEGSTVFKEMEGLKDLSLRMSTYEHMFREKPSGSGSGGNKNLDPNIRFHMAMSTLDPPGLHNHMVEIPQSEVEHLKNDKKATFNVETEVGNTHSHNLVIRYDKKANKPWIVEKCDNQDECWDQHPLFLEEGE